MRVSSLFHAPADLRRPLIMIGPGVGVAPFVGKSFEIGLGGLTKTYFTKIKSFSGFLQQREKQLKDANLVNVNQCWLFYGCRYPNRDMIYR